MRRTNSICKAGLRPVRMLLSGMLVLICGSQVASAQPDLVINIDDSVIRAGSCDTNSELASGRIAIKNIGTSQAKMKILERVTRSMLAVYVPENISIVDKKTKSEQLDVFDQESINFSIGSGVSKRGHFFGVPPNRVATKNLIGNASGNVTAIQAALNELGHDAGASDGVIGARTREAIKKFQRSINAAPTGSLTNQQRNRLLGETDVKVETTATTGAQGRVTVTLYAAVDPYDLVAESNEANNIVKFTVNIDCGATSN